MTNGTRVADVRPLVDRRAADVHPDLRRRLGQRDERFRRGVVEADGHRGVIAAAARRERLVARDGGDHRPQLGAALGARSAPAGGT